MFVFIGWFGVVFFVQLNKNFKKCLEELWAYNLRNMLNGFGKMILDKIINFPLISQWHSSIGLVYGIGVWTIFRGDGYIGAFFFQCLCDHKTPPFGKALQLSFIIPVPRIYDLRTLGRPYPCVNVISVLNGFFNRIGLIFQ